MVLVRLRDGAWTAIEPPLSKNQPGTRRPDRSRAIDGPWGAIGRILDACSPRDCDNDFTNAGY